MQIILANGKELNPIMVSGSSRYVQGSNRDTLEFVFPVETSLDELDAIFTPENCETIKIVEGENEFIHNAYTIRAELKRCPMVVAEAIEETEEVVENRVTVSMSQRTYAESKLARLASESTDTQLAVAELAEIIMGGM